MKRRKFFTTAAVGAAGTSFIFPIQACKTPHSEAVNGIGKGRKAKNIIFMVSDGMSSGTLNMGDLFIQRRDGRGSAWLDLYRNQRVTRALMDTSSANSLVTDSAAGGSAWGGGHKVPNGRLNTGPNNEEYMPILQKFKKAGKKVGCVTTVPITHATPASFCVSQQSRGDQADIAEKYLGLRFDVMLGGGGKYFINRKDDRNMYQEFANKGFQVVNNKTDLAKANKDRPVLGVFDEDGLAYDIDRLNDPVINAFTPSLAEMSAKAIELLSTHPEGFVLQIEGGKVDWAAHANDTPALIYDQVAFDSAVRTVIDFAERDGNTLVILTTDHGNANPGLYYSKANDNFDTLFHYKRSNNFILSQFERGGTINLFAERIKSYQGFKLSDEKLKSIYSSYENQKAEGLYNDYKLPYAEYASYQKDFTSVAFGGDNHTGDFVELAAFGPGSEKIKPFVVNTDLHYLMLEAAEIENRF